MKHLRFLTLILCISLVLPIYAGAVYTETSWSMDAESLPQIQIIYLLTGIIPVDQKLTTYYFDWLSDVRAMAAEDARLKEENSFGPAYEDTWGTYELTAEQFAAEDTVSFLFTEYYGRFAAVHPSAGYIGKTFRLSTGEPVNLASLVADGQWENLVSKVREALYRDADMLDWANTEGNWLEVGISAEDAFDAFALTDEALIIQFQPYQIGPYALGAARIEIPRAELVGILR